MAKTKTGRSCPYTGIHVRSNLICLSQEFCARYIKQNKFVSLDWDNEKGILKLTFYLSDSDISFRIPLIQHTDGSFRARSAKFFSHLRQFKRGRYEIFDIELSREGIVTFKFKLEKL